jgi:cytidylate kinase
MTLPIIAIDGPAASGKGTIARRLAQRFGFGYMDTGLLYRAVGLAVMDDGGDPADEIAATRAAHNMRDHFDPAMLEEEYLRSDIAGLAASHVAAIASVREALLYLQQDFSRNPGKDFKGSVLDGRDIGTIICPQAPCKLFITAATEIRAMRRYKELQSRAISTTYDTVLRDMRARDERDTERKAAPMITAKDAVVLHTDDWTADQAFAASLKVVEEKIPHIQPV